MKFSILRIVLTMLFLLKFIFTQGQIIIGTNNLSTVSSGTLLGFNTVDKAILLTRIQSTSLVTNPIDGMLVYEMNCGCVKLYSNGHWSITISKSPYSDNFFEILRDGVKDRYFGDGKHDFIYMPIVGEDGRVWLNNNLGANYSNMNNAMFNPYQQATNYNDYNSYGSLFQWGRIADGHELISWTSSTNGEMVTGYETSRNDDPTHQKFIIPYSSVSPYGIYQSWRRTAYPDNEEWRFNNLERGVLSNCPIGYKAPSLAEFENYFAKASIVNAGIFTNKLKFVTPGRRTYINNSKPEEAGTRGLYWTSTRFNDTNAQRIALNYNQSGSSIVPNIANMYFGFSIRCIKHKN